MSLLAQQEVQKAVYLILSGDVTLQGLIGVDGNSNVKVYDIPRSNTDFPYITINCSETPENTFKRFGKRIDLVTSVWSQVAGMKEAQIIAKRINEILDFQPLSVTGFSHVMTSFQSAPNIPQQDGLTVQIPITYDVFIQQN